MIITGEETVVCAQPKNQATVISVEEQIISTSTRKVRRVCSNAKSILVFFDTRGVVRYNFVPQGQIVNSVSTLTPSSG
jgi:hypothetical protein